MKHELLALVSGRHTASSDANTVAVPHAGYTAVFQPRTPTQVFGQTLRRNRLLAASKRQACLERLMQRGTVLPFAPATMLDPEDTAALIACNADAFDTLVGRMGGRVQYQISVEWAEDRVLAQFRDAPEIKPLFAASSVSGQTVSAAVSKLADRLGLGITSQLSRIACEFAELPRKRGLIANTVILIEDHKEPALEEALAAIDAIWPDGFRIRQIGPGPAVSFAMLTLQSFSTSDIARAHRVLDLSGEISFATIRDARQKLLRDASAKVSEIRFAARLAHAALEVADRRRPFPLVDIWSEGRASHGELEHVA